jgi:uncharacterized protein (DUF433 family)
MSNVPHVTSLPDILGGQPCFAGTRIPVDALFVNLAAGEHLDTILNSYPGLTRESAVAVLKEACRLVRERVLNEFPPEIRARLGSVMYEHDWSGLSKTESESHYGRL